MSDFVTNDNAIPRATLKDYARVRFVVLHRRGMHDLTKSMYRVRWVVL